VAPRRWRAAGAPARGRRARRRRGHGRHAIFASLTMRTRATISRGEKGQGFSRRRAGLQRRRRIRRRGLRGSPRCPPEAWRNLPDQIEAAVGQHQIQDHQIATSGSAAARVGAMLTVKLCHPVQGIGDRLGDRRPVLDDDAIFGMAATLSAKSLCDRSVPRRMAFTWQPQQAAQLLIGRSPAKWARARPGAASRCPEFPAHEHCAAARGCPYGVSRCSRRCRSARSRSDP
jgi:hypothetical protein